MLARRLLPVERRLETIERARPALDAALHWIDEYGDARRRRFRRVRAPVAGRLRNQGWKDSGTRSCTPTAPGRGADRAGRGPGLRLPGQAADRRRLRALGAPSAAARLRGEAAERCAAFDDAFWDPEEGSFALALDGRQAAGRERHLEPGALSATAASRRRRARERRSAADGARHVLRLGHAHARPAIARLQPDELPQRLGLAARQRDRRRRA